MAFPYISAVSDGTNYQAGRKGRRRMDDLHEALLKACMWCAPDPLLTGVVKSARSSDWHAVKVTTWWLKAFGSSVHLCQFVCWTYPSNSSEIQGSSRSAWLTYLLALCGVNYLQILIWVTINSVLWLQVARTGQLSGQMAEIMGGVVETFGEYNTEINPHQYEEEEELTKVTF